MPTRRVSVPRLRTVFLAAFFSLIAITAILPRAAIAAPTTSITVKKVASDGSTVLAEKTVDYLWLKDPANVPVLGDGVTHYYHQGPVFVDHPDEKTRVMLRWNPEEDTNVETKDMGALKGTNVRDLCELVGGMEEGDKLQIKASDGLRKTFAYRNVYQYSVREGPMVVCWYKDGQYPDTGFNDGMRLVWFADASTNPWGMHVFGNWDWHEAAEEEYWYYFQTGDQKYPTTTGLSVQSVSELIIRSYQHPEPAQPVPDPEPNAPKVPVAAFAADITSGNAPLTVTFTDRSDNSPVRWSWDFDDDGEEDSSSQNPSHTYDKPGVYSVRLIAGNSAGSDQVVKEDYIVVSPALPTEVEVSPSAPSEGQGAFPFLTVTIAAVVVAACIAACLRLKRR